MDEARIEKACRAICSARGLDPDEEIWGGVTDFGPHDYQRGGFVPMVAVSGLRWRTFWYRALDALAVSDGA